MKLNSITAAVCAATLLSLLPAATVFAQTTMHHRMHHARMVMHHRMHHARMVMHHRMHHARMVVHHRMHH